MNRAQHIALSCGFVCLLVAAIVPPWRRVEYLRNSTWRDTSIGHGLLLSPPKPGGKHVRIDTGMLLAEITIVTGSTGLIVMLLGIGGVQRFLWPLDHP